MRYLIAVLLVFNFAFAKAQNYWTTAQNIPTENLENRKFIPESYQILSLDFNGLQTAVQNAPMRFSGINSTTIIDMPDSNGDFHTYTIYETRSMEEPLAIKFPQIKTYIGYDLIDASHVIRFSITPHGFHNIEFKIGSPTVYTDPYTTDHQLYMIYDRSDLPLLDMTDTMICETDESAFLGSGNTVKRVQQTLATDDSNLRTYRIAISCNAEYGNIFAGTGTDAQRKANIQAQQVITMNRVNGVYERDLAMNMVFVGNNDVLLYYGDTSLDPYTNNFNSRTQDLIDGNLAGQGFPGIGDANYDIGHNFNTSGGGNAGCIGCVCTSGSKGSGMTGQSNPTGDPFDIDYVAHEIGHQFGGFHSMASSNCRSGSGQTEAEPGSGSTIMAYAGICNPNIQNNSDDYFHYVNIRDITANIQSGVSSSCAVVTSATATPPVANAGADYTIPFSTAFVLNGSATNLGTAQTIGYNWEQIDTNNPSSNLGPVSDRTVGPMYRSRPISATSERYLPRLSDVVQGNLTPTFEVTPSVARNMNFAFTVRKYDNSIGQNDSDLMTITVDGSIGPFEVTSQNTLATFSVGDALPVTWNVNGTDGGSVNTALVDILLSTNGGVSFDILLADDVPNDGSETVILPNNPTSQARIIVRAVGNVFYAVNTSSFSVNATNYALTTSDLDQVVCLPADAIYNFNYVTYSGFTENTQLGISGLPAGASATINPTTVTSNNTPVTITVTGLTNASIGSYTLTLTATAPSESKNIDLGLNVFDATLNAASLNLPADASIDIPLFSTLEWMAATGAQEYDVEIATDAGFTNIVANATITGTQYTAQLDENTQYFWRVTSRNDCGATAVSAVRSFTTAAIICNNVPSAQIPVTISAGPPASITSTITITDDVILNSMTLDLDISHSYMSDLDISLTSPAGTTINLIQDRCGFRNDLLATFSDDGAALSCSFFSPTVNGVILPEDPFSTFAGESTLGDWTLTVFDDTNQDGGTLNAWSIDYCGTQTLSVDTNELSFLRLYPNPVDDQITLDLGNYAFAKAAYIIYDMSGKVLRTDTINNTQTTIDLSEVATGVYLMKIIVDNGSRVERLIKR